MVHAGTRSARAADPTPDHTVRAPFSAVPGLLVDTAWVSPDRRFDYWQSAIADVAGPVRLERRETQPFDGRVFGFSLGPLMVHRLSSGPSLLVRSPADVRSADGDEFLLVLLESGRYIVGHDGFKSLVRPGELFLCDRTVPQRIDCGGDSFSSLMLTIPRSMIHPHQDKLRHLVGRGVPGNEGAGRLVKVLLQELSLTASDGDLPLDEFRLAEGTLDIVLALFLAWGRDKVHPTQLPKSALLAQVKQFIDDQLQDPWIDPESIAHAHYISVRMLYKLFEGSGSTVAEYIRKRRLERCRHDLADPGLADTPVMDVAARWGFANPTHFSRLFRVAIGCSPREYRQYMLAKSQ
jgi:AraC-like DNA-binding protein